jgi:hypothetical protein
MTTKAEINHRLRVGKLPQSPTIPASVFDREPEPDEPALEKYVCWKLTCYICRKVDFVEAMGNPNDTLTKLDLRLNVLTPLQPVEPEQPDRYVCKDCASDPVRQDLVRRIQVVNNNAIGKQDSPRWFDGDWAERRAWLERMLWVWDAVRRNEREARCDS